MKAGKELAGIGRDKGELEVVLSRGFEEACNMICVCTSGHKDGRRKEIDVNELAQGALLVQGQPLGTRQSGLRRIARRHEQGRPTR